MSDLYYTGEFQRLSFGDKGLRVVSSGSTTTTGENFCAIQALEGSTISCDIDTIGGDTSITSLLLSTGQVIYGNFNDITVSSGKIVAYLR
jgi:hypothetical protein